MNGDLARGLLNLDNNVMVKNMTKMEKLDIENYMLMYLANVSGKDKLSRNNKIK
jgi:hypothetical protein